MEKMEKPVFNLQFRAFCSRSGVCKLPGNCGLIHTSEWQTSFELLPSKLEMEKLIKRERKVRIKRLRNERV